MLDYTIFATEMPNRSSISDLCNARVSQFRCKNKNIYYL